ncbi:hypothetical protein M419DRAFT_120112 [Trichoderma reesei RUT C-30]|uniref:Uncharacterized protein n=1 Tax=Hypocrea jecorina (strain ATCC 56765 / BCRC 32924 / NRRL 11460 / Rut C-30) TaxID=1344414 RepID=A0A024S375_HYPJR|nr:hypothetical protein M419DRAFT_120112 [Trichoderma reesei RUT C-30]
MKEGKSNVPDHINPSNRTMFINHAASLRASHHGSIQKCFGNRSLPRSLVGLVPVIAPYPSTTPSFQSVLVPVCL